MYISKILAELALRTDTESIPASSFDAARKMLLDTLGCMLAGVKAPGIAPLLELERELAARGSGTVIRYGDRLALPSAAFMNSTMAHALDFDNNYPGADIHILGIVVPVAFACAEERECSGRDFLSAMILGVEVAARIAKPYMQAGRAHNYFLTTSLVGGWGGVATAARLLGLSVGQTVNALGIYYAHTCGNRQTLLERKLSKRMQPAIAARAALYSVLLAQKGFTGPEQTFEGKAGFYRLYTLDAPPPENSFRVPPAPFGIEELVVKHFPTCGIHHGNVVAALQLREKHGIRCEDIEGVEFFLQEGGNTLVSMPFNMGETPQIDAQFSAPYAIALALTRGEVHVRDFQNCAIENDDRTADLARRTVEVTHFRDMKLAAYPQAERGHRYIKVVLKNGDVLEHAARIGDLKEMDMSGVEQKFRQCFSLYPGGNDEDAGRIIKAVKDFGGVSSVKDFFRRRCGGQGNCERQE